ncbi:hypothetical protein Q9290_05100 [Oceanimonas sp. CHS3-5]|uniref:hypothetical protein n=1 Tax=Oceanimonas sp. CHS3-5 TaxID=3068186 RepID=UPI00273EF198|nr:hypothetical protein [Oceanimonas sp. CHS3-5]MDP5291664.1 hypothetical protein [Oceanimonas sp. CHS3-5]
MDNVSRMNAASTPPPCIWSADDCYPAHVLHWLQQQAHRAEPGVVVNEPEAELDIV